MTKLRRGKRGRRSKPTRGKFTPGTTPLLDVLNEHNPERKVPSELREKQPLQPIFSILSPWLLDRRRKVIENMPQMVGKFPGLGGRRNVDHETVGILRIIAQSLREKEPTKETRDRFAAVIEKIVEDPLIRDATRPNPLFERDMAIALEYEIRKQMLGDKRASTALDETARSWGCSVGTVKDAYGEWGTPATWDVERALREHVGTLMVVRPVGGCWTSVIWTRETVLARGLYNLDQRRKYLPKVRRKRKSEK